MKFKYLNITILRYQGARGSILLESLIAITILTIGMLGIFSMLSRSVSLTRVVANQYIAAHLAAEGIELIKNTIDTNTLAGRPWNAGLASGIYEIAYDTPLEPDDDRTLFYDTTTGLYDYASGDEPTEFRRQIELARIGADELQVNSRVSWVSRGSAEFNINLEDHFFNSK